MQKNFRILSILVMTMIITIAVNSFAKTSNLVTTITGTTVKSTTIGLGSGVYPALYTSSSTYASIFSFTTSVGTSQYHDATVGSTFTVTELGTTDNDIVIVNQKNKTSHIANNYSGVVFY